jgi:uncharacterized membrane protein YccC
MTMSSATKTRTGITVLGAALAATVLSGMLPPAIAVLVCAVAALIAVAAIVVTSRERVSRPARSEEPRSVGIAILRDTEGGDVL